MASYFNTAVDWLRSYAGDGWHVVLFLPALAYILFARCDKRLKRFLAAYTVLFLFLYFCPVTAKIIMDYCIGEEVYWRMLWLLPIPFVIAFAGTLLFRHFRKKAAQILCLTALVLVIAFTGRSMYFGEDSRYTLASNWNKIPTEMYSVCQIILEDGDPSAVKKAVVPEEMVSYVRQYTAQIELVFGRRGNLGKRAQRVYDEMTSPDPDLEALTVNARKLSVDYLVYVYTEERYQKLLELGWEEIAAVGNYRVYRDARTG